MFSIEFSKEFTRILEKLQKKNKTMFDVIMDK